jgi:hypothetical protein
MAMGLRFRPLPNVGNPYRQIKRVAHGQRAASNHLGTLRR